MPKVVKQDAERLERLRCLLGNGWCQFIVVYRRQRRFLGGLKLRWCRACSAEPEQSREVLNKLAAHYQAAAALAFRYQGSIVRQEVEGPAGGRFRNWHGLKVPLNPSAGLASGAEPGTGWWMVFVSGGALGRAGYVVVARLAAADKQEVRETIGQMQAIWAEDEKPRRPGILQRLSTAVRAAKPYQARIVRWALGVTAVSYVGGWWCLRGDPSAEVTGLGLALQWVFTVLYCLGWMVLVVGGIWGRLSREEVAAAVELGALDPASLPVAGRVSFYLSYGSLPKWVYMPFLVVGVGMAALMVLGMIGMVIHFCL